jgi:hypothetical protein
MSTILPVWLHWVLWPMNGGANGGYAFWSGIGSGTPVIGAVLWWSRRHNCHVAGCPRLIWKKVPGTDYEVCRKHHPHDAPTHSQVLVAHRKAQKLPD